MFKTFSSKEVQTLFWMQPMLSLIITNLDCESNFAISFILVQLRGCIEIHFSGKNLWTKMTNGAKIELYQAKDATDEAQRAVQVIQKFTREHSDVKLSDIAILYRTNAQCMFELYRKYLLD